MTMCGGCGEETDPDGAVCAECSDLHDACVTRLERRRILRGVEWLADSDSDAWERLVEYIESGEEVPGAG